MNFTALQAEMTSLVAFGGFSNISPTIDYADYINRGLKQFSWDAEYLVSELTIPSVASQAEYTLAVPDWRAIEEVYYNTNRIMESSPNEMANLNKAWRNTSAGTPSRYWQTRPNTLRLYPKPATSSVDILIVGTRCEADLSSGSDTPNCPQVFHRAIALRAAVMLMQRYAQNSEASRAASYLNEYKDMVKQLRQEVMSQNAPMARHVRTREQSRVLI